MRRINQNQPDLDLIRLLDRSARLQGGKILDVATHTSFLEESADRLQEHRQEDTQIHGLRIQAMFAYVAAALGKCHVIKEEDAGDIYVMDENLRVPDYRIVTDDHEILVEVKNHHPRNPTDDYVLRHPYSESLQHYAEAFHKNLYFAIYWSQLKQWTLIRHDRFDADGDQYRVSFSEAMKRSEMNLIGDCMIGIVPSLKFRVISDPARDRNVGADGQANFTIGGVQFLVDGNVIEDPLEKRIAWFLLNNGSWPTMQLDPVINDGQLMSVEFETKPESRENPEEDFEIIGTMSQMISHQYNEATATNGRVDLLLPDRDPDQFGVIIPSGFNGETLRLWRFYMTPSFP